MPFWGPVCAIIILWSYSSAADIAPLKTLEGFAAPECVVVDASSGFAYVSNINASPELYWQDTGEGFISRLSPDGSLERLRWIESSPDFVIHQPKGMAIHKGKLFVADNSRLLSFSLSEAKGISVIPIPGAQRLNDMAVDEKGTLYVSDIATNKVFCLKGTGDSNPRVVAELESVNGITVHKGEMYAVSWGLHEVYKLFPSGSRPPEPFRLSEFFTNLDGIEAFEDGSFIVSDYMGNKIFRIAPNRREVRILYELTTPADIGIDRVRHWLYVPQLQPDKVVIFSIKKDPTPANLTAARNKEFIELQRHILERPTWNNERLARETWRTEALVLETDRTPLDIVARRTIALCKFLQDKHPTLDLSYEAAVLDSLLERVAHVQKRLTPEDEIWLAMLLMQPKLSETIADMPEILSLFHALCAIRRRIAFANPLLDFDRIVFLKRHKALFEHMCDQYYGIAARPGGGLFILENAFTDSPSTRNILETSVVERGRLQGQPLRGGVSPATLHYNGEGILTESSDPGGGAFLSPALSYDGAQILFSYVECLGDPRHRFKTENPGAYWKEPWDPGRAYHIFKVNVDGTQLEQLTDGPWNDIHPCWMPDGRIVFVSERRGGFLRCGRVCPTYTMFQMNADGSFIRPFSYHETHEWLPSVDNNGMVVYTRWDYVDRDSDIAHHLWLTYPDGRDPRGPHGNYPRVRELRPWMELHFRAIPGSHKYSATASTHHGQHFGSIITVDLRIEDDHATSQIRRITPEAMFPEAESAPGVPFSPRGGGNKGQVYGTPWPLSEDFYLAVYDPYEQHHDLYLVDSFGNRELLYTDPEIGCSDPIPLKPRPVPPVIPSQTHYSQDPNKQPKTGKISVANVYDSTQPWPEGTRIKALRVIQLFPKSTPAPGEPNIGAGDESIARGSLGTVPVEDDGSVYFEAPAGITFYFQALDERGRAVQTMNSATYLHPGEHLSCAGCHEPKQASPAKVPGYPTALRNPPAQLMAEPEGSYPLQFSRLVQPVLDAKCVECHRKEEKAPDLSADVFGDYGWSQAFLSLRPYVWTRHGGNFIGLQRNKTSYSIPGQVGARASQLLTLLENGHHDVRLTEEELRRITLWIDANSVFYGAYHDIAAQARGERVFPHLQ